MQERFLRSRSKTHALAWAIAESSVADIDRMNILQATMAAMRKAVLQLDPKPDLVLVDATVFRNFRSGQSPLSRATT